MAALEADSLKDFLVIFAGAAVAAVIIAVVAPYVNDLLKNFAPKSA